MSSLTSCIKKAGKALSPQDITQLKQSLQDYMDEGLSRESASIKAVDDLLGEWIQEQQSFFTRVNELGGQLPDLPKKNSNEKFQDFGAEIGGARKDLSTKGRKKGAKIEHPEYEGKPGYYRQYYVAEAVKMPGRIYEEGEFEGGWSLWKKAKGKASPFNQDKRVADKFKTEDEAWLAVPIAEVSVKHRVGRKSDTEFYIYRNVAKGKYPVMKDGFKSREEAMQYMITHADELIKSGKALGEGIRPNLDKVERTGTEHRKGNVSPKNFEDTFGFYGGQFGIWNNNDDRQADLNFAYDAFMDLAEVLNVSPKSLSLNGELAIAFGARGKGLTGAKAHYERDFGVINLTKINGAGSLAHEWFHAFDHYLGRQSGQTAAERTGEGKDAKFETQGRDRDFVSHGFSYNTKTRKELQEAFTKVVKTAMQATEDYFEDTTRYSKVTEKQIDNVEHDIADVANALEKSYENDSYVKRHKKPASKKQISEYARLTKPIRDAMKNRKPISLESRTVAGRSRYGNFRYTNDDIEAISVLYKKVRGRTGFTSERKGILDKFINSLRRYNEALHKLQEGEDQVTKKRTVPTNFRSEATNLDLYRVADYWGTNHEMMARAFESYVVDQVELGKHRSDYLVYGADNSYYAAYNVKPYPEGDERQRINHALTDFFKVVEEKTTEKGQALFLRNSDKKTTSTRSRPSITRKQADKAIHEITDQWRGADRYNEVSLVETYNDLPAEIKETAKEQGAEGKIDGVFHKGTIYIVLDKVQSTTDVERVLFHEAYGHYGLRKLFGKDVSATMNALFFAIGGNSGLNRIAQKHHIDLSEYQNNLIGMSEFQRSSLMMEELLAHIAQENKPDIKTKLKTLLGAIKNWFRERGFKGLAKMGDSDLFYLLKKSKESVIKGKGGKSGDTRFVIPSEKIKAPNKEVKAKFSRTAHHPTEAFNDLDQDQINFYKKIGPRSIPQRISDRINEVRDRIGLKVRQGMVDSFAAFKVVDERARGDLVVEEDTANSSWVLARMSRAAGGAINALIGHGRISMQGGVIDVDPSTESLVDILKKLGGSAEVERFMGWVAANRANSLKAQDKENLFTQTEISAGQRANQGRLSDGRNRATIYNTVFQEFQVIQDDVLGIAEQAGIISDETRNMWKDEFYVPFYRVMDDSDVSGPHTVGGGLSRQQAYKKLKGGKQNLNDLLENTLMNFEHLISASLKNQAAAKAIENAEMVNIAVETIETQRDKNASTFILKDGVKTWYDIADPMVFAALTAMGSTGMNGTAMKVMRSFKRVFTNFITASPQFMAANLIRDSFQSVALADMKKNPIANVIKGINQYGVFDKQKAARAHLQATGGAFSFGHVYGEDSDSIKMELNRMLRNGSIIQDGHDVLTLLKKGWDAYHGVSDSLENANRAAVYDKALEDGKTKLQAAFVARDLMDFSSQGNWTAMRFLISVVPFLNARLQGLDKIYRSGIKPGTSVIRSMFPGANPATDTDKKAAARFGSVAGALALATMALYMGNKDDEEYKKLEDWQKDTYWFIKIGGNGFFIPKPFEVGAIATLAERSLQQMVDDKATGTLFAERIGHMLLDTFSFNPTPQLFSPVIDVYANKDSFTGRQIESMGQKRFSPSLRVRSNTSRIAKGISALTENTAGAIFGKDSSLVFSPVQIDYLIGGYLGWVGESTVASVDVMASTMSGDERPAKAWSEYQPFRRFYKDLSLPGYTKYQTAFYDNLKEIGRIHLDIKRYRELGEIEKAQQLFVENKDKLRYRQLMNRIQRKLTKLNNQAKMVRKSNDSSDAKRRRLDMIQAQKNRLTENIAKRIE